MIRALIEDIDGVLVGEKIGYNSPYPHPDVIRRLSAIRRSGIPVVLATGKPHYSVAPIIDQAGLDNPHITNGGSVVIDPIQNSVIASYPIDKDIALGILETCITHGFYTELYTKDAYYLTRSQKLDLTPVHAHILQREPILVESLSDIAGREDVVKIMPITHDEAGMSAVDTALTPFLRNIVATWGIHPIANPHQFCGVTAKGISKRQTTLDVLSHLDISPEDALGIGDSTSDWNYMDLCGYVAAVENAQEPLKDLVRKRADRGFIGGHVDNNGILSVFDHFGLPVADTLP